MNTLLQTLRPVTEESRARGFDPVFWNCATTLTYFGVELCVQSGSISVSLRHRDPEGRIQEVAVLDCPGPGSAFSPAFRLSDWAQQEGTLIAVQVTASEEAVFDLYVGSNDFPLTPEVRLAVVGWNEDPSAVKRLDNEFTKLRDELIPADHRDWISLHSCVGTSNRQGLYRTLHRLGYASHQGLPFTHVALLPQMTGEALVNPDLWGNTLGVARYLHENAFLHSSAGGVSDWPLCCFDMRQVYRQGLPRGHLDDYLRRFEYAGLTRYCPDGTLPALPKMDKATLVRQKLVSLVRHEPSSDLSQSKLDSANLLRHLQLRSAQQQRGLEERLQHNGVWNSAQTRGDLERASRGLCSLLRNRHAGKRAVIVGNGPSLKIKDLERLEGAVSFASNKIYLAYEQTAWRPTYYSVEDHLVLKNSREQIEALDGSIKIFPASMRDHGYHAGDAIFAQFLPPASFDDPLSDPEFPSFSRDLSHGIAWGSTIVYSQIQMALYMGCREIVLIGVDHDYQMPDTKQGNQYVFAGERNHFHPEYRQPGEVWHQPNLDVLEVSYTRAKDVCESAGATIVNASRQTRLNVFDRVEFDQIFPPQEH